MRRRLVLILASPIIVPIFLIGWILYCVGNKQGSPDKATAKKSSNAEKQAKLKTDKKIEMGLIEEKIAVRYILTKGSKSINTAESQPQPEDNQL